MSINTVKYERHAGSGQDLVELAGSFVTAGASAPATITGKGFTVSAPSTGVYSITVDRAYGGLQAAVATLGGGAANAGVKIGAYTASTGVLTIVTEGAVRGTAANLTGPVVHFVVKFIKYAGQV